MRRLFSFDRSNPLAYMELNRILRKIPKDRNREFERRIERLEKSITDNKMNDDLKETVHMNDDLKETVQRDTQDLEVLVRATEKHKIIVAALNLEITNLKKQIEELKEVNFHKRIERSDVEGQGAISIAKENEKLRDKIEEYKKLYGSDRVGGWIEIKNLIQKIGEEYFILCEHGNGIPLGCVKQSCVSIRSIALALIGVIAATEQEHTEDVTRSLKRQNKTMW